MSGYCEVMWGTPFPTSMCTHACTWMNKQKKQQHRKKQKEKQSERLSVSYALCLYSRETDIMCWQDKLSSHWISAVLHRDLDLGGSRLSSLLSRNSSTFDPLFSQLLSVNVKSSFSVSDMYWQLRHSQLWAPRMPLTFPCLLVDLFLLMAHGGRKQFDESGPALLQPV